MKIIISLIGLSALSSFCFAETTTPSINEQSAREYCQTMLSYRVGSLMNIKTEKTEKIAGMDKWLVTGTVKQSPELTFACLVKKSATANLELEKIELFQLQKQ